MSKNLFTKYILVLSIVPLYISTRDIETLPTFKSNQLYDNNQYYADKLNEERRLFNKFKNSVRPTHSSIKNFLTDTFNNTYYSEFLALDFSHVLNFLSFARQTQEPNRYIRSILRLFSQKIKGTSYINAHAFLNFLDRLSVFLNTLPTTSNQNNIYPKQKNIKPQIKNYLYNYFLSNFDKFKQNPEQELEKISADLSDVANQSLLNNSSANLSNNMSSDISTENLQSHIIRFLELSLNKLIWSPQDQELSWNNLKTISSRLEKLMLNNIIPDMETLNELYWSLIQRYCYFLELAGSELKRESIEKIFNDLQDKQLPLWSLEEQETYTTNKKTYLKNALFTAKASSNAKKLKLMSRF